MSQLQDTMHRIHDLCPCSYCTTNAYCHEYDFMLPMMIVENMTNYTEEEMVFESSKIEDLLDLSQGPPIIEQPIIPDMEFFGTEILEQISEYELEMTKHMRPLPASHPSYRMSSAYSTPSQPQNSVMGQVFQYEDSTQAKSEGEMSIIDVTPISIATFVMHDSQRSGSSASLEMLEAELNKEEDKFFE